MSWNTLAFLADPKFVLPWYVIGIIGSIWIGVDLSRTNTPLKQAMKWAWPIIVLFFSVIGLALYFGTARAPGIGSAKGEDEKKKLHEDYERNVLRRVNGAVIHCVAGDGLGIMTAMVIARVTGMTFWQEFWFEYGVGFAFGWFIFQLKSMTMMTDSKAMALWMAFRGEFFSMLTVMGGMGAIMTYVTPAVVGAQPTPLTFGFWGFGMFGLLAGYVFTYPMNFMLVKIGWKHGMGSSKDAHPVQAAPARAGLFAAMSALGIAAMVLPAWLQQVRVGTPVAVANAETAGMASSAPASAAILEQGLRQSLGAAQEHLGKGRRSEATNALDAAMRAAMVGKEAEAGEGFGRALAGIRAARRTLQNGHSDAARQTIASTLSGLGSISALEAQRTPADNYKDVPVINARGTIIGEVQSTSGGQVELALGGARDVWGVWDMSANEVASVPASAIIWGPRKHIGKSFVMLPTLQKPPVRLAAR